MDARDRQRLSSIAHATSTMWGPISDGMLERIVDRIVDLGLGGSSRVVDLGSGPAELLRRVVGRTGASGIGVDSSPFALAEARRRLRTRAEASRIGLREADVTTLVAVERFDLVVCIGPGWDHGGWSELTAWASRFANPAGHLLLADGAWRSPPADEDLALLGMKADDYAPSERVADEVRRGGAELVWQAVVSAADWDAYGTAYRGAMLDFLDRSSTDPLAPLLRERTGPGWVAYERLHRMLDFVIVLARPRTVG